MAGQTSEPATREWLAMKEGHSDMELRKQTRFELQVPVEIEWQSKSGKQKARGFTRDISSKGAFLFCEPEVSLGSHIHLTIFLRSDGLGPQITLDIVGKVCRVVKAVNDGEMSGLAVENYRLRMNGKLTEEELLVD